MNKIEFKKHIRNIIYSKTLDTSFNDLDLENLIIYHPYKIFDIQSFKVVECLYRTRTLYINNKDGTCDSISVIKCIDNKFKSKRKYNEDNTIKAFRLCSYKKIKTYEDIECCELCKSNIKPLHVDHFPTSFKTIFTNFLNIENIELSTIKVIKKDISYFLEDIILQNKWIKYHDINARFRILCFKCNCSFGDYQKNHRFLTTVTDGALTLGCALRTTGSLSCLEL